MSALQNIIDAQGWLEQMPMGGIGTNGATDQELLDAEESGHCYEGDAVYHNSQRAWLLLEQARKELSK